MGEDDKLNNDAEANGKKAPSAAKMSASAALEQMLGYGRWQWFQVWVFSTFVCFIGAMNTFQMVFMVTRKPHRCALPGELERDHYDHTTFDNHTTISSHCSMALIDTTSSHCVDVLFEHPGEMIQHPCVNTSHQIDCTHGNIHQTEGSDHFWSLTAENEWVCDREQYGSNIMTAQSVGIVFNSLVFMQLSDSWGRQPVFHITNLAYLLSRLVILVNFESYWLTMLIVALGSGFYPVGIRVAYTVIAEYTNELGRLHLYVAGWVSWVFGIAFLSVVAWLTADWFYYGLLTALANLLLIPFWWLSPESPRLLLTQGKIDQAEKIIRNIKMWNKEEVPDDFTEQLTAISREIRGEKKAGVVGLLTSRRMALITLLFSITWVVNDFFYIGGQMNVENLAGNQFVNFAMVAFTEFPSVFVGEYIANRMGRRWSHVLCHFLTTVFFLAIVPIAGDESQGTTVTVLAICAKTMSNIGWFLNYLQNMETFPTIARVSGMNLTATVSVIIGTTAPYFILLGDSHIELMYGIFAMLGVVGMLAAAFLPESYKEEFPECIEDIERRPTYPFFSWRVWKYKKVVDHSVDEEKEKMKL